MAKTVGWKVRVRVEYTTRAIDVLADSAEDAIEAAYAVASSEIPDDVTDGFTVFGVDGEPGYVVRSLEVNPAAKWVRYRFTEASGETQPYLHSPHCPYWCSGYDGNDNPIIITWLPEGESVERVWLKPVDITEYDDREDAPVFVGRFQRPEWYRPVGS